MKKQVTDEQRAVRSARLKALWADPEFRKKRDAKLFTKEVQARKAATMSQVVWADPKYKARVGAAISATASTPEAKLKKSAAMKEAWSDGSIDRELHARKMKEHWQDTAYAERVLASAVPRIKQQAKLNAENPVWRANMSASIKAFQNQPAQLAANAEMQRKLWSNPGYKQKMMGSRRSKHMYSPEWRLKISAGLARRYPEGRTDTWNAGKTKDTDPRLKKMSENMRGRIPWLKRRTFWYRGEDGTEIRMRSTWEVGYAYYLDAIGVKWEFERRFFYIGPGGWKGETYNPDFFLTDERRFVEIKGHLPPRDAAKVSLFCLLYPKVRWSMLDLSKLQALGILDRSKRAVLRKKIIADAIEINARIEREKLEKSA